MRYADDMRKRGLVADAGGTNVRFALVDLEGDVRPDLVSPREYTSRDFGSIEDAAKAYLSAQKSATAPVAAVLSLAGPVAAARLRAMS